MCQGVCPSNAGPQAGSVEAQLRLALAEIQTMANQQLQAVLALPRKDGQEPPAAFAMQLIATRAAAALEEAAATVTPAPAQTVLFHRPGQPGERSWAAKCGCRSTADCNCMSMDMTARLLYQSHEAHRRAA